eukprot:1850097-Amphidinium_carterae.2
MKRFLFEWSSSLCSRSVLCCGTRDSLVYSLGTHLYCNTYPSHVPVVHKGQLMQLCFVCPKLYFGKANHPSNTLARRSL